jgi:hypothetical protein
MDFVASEDRKRAREDSGDDDMEQAEMQYENETPYFEAASATPAGGVRMNMSAATAAATAAAAAVDVSTIPTDLLSEDLRTLLESMDEFTPTIPDAVTTYYLRKSGFATSDLRVYVRTGSLCNLFLFTVFE